MHPLVSDVLSEPYEIAGILVGVGIVCAGARAAVRAVRKFTRHLNLVHEAIVGRPAEPGVQAIPSVIERFDDVNAHLVRQDTQIAELKGIVTNGLSHRVDEAAEAAQGSAARIDTFIKEQRAKEG